MFIGTTTKNINLLLGILEILVIVLVYIILKKKTTIIKLKIYLKHCITHINKTTSI